MLTSMFMLPNSCVHINTQKHLLQYSSIVTLIQFKTYVSSQIHPQKDTCSHIYTCSHIHWLMLTDLQFNSLKRNSDKYTYTHVRSHLHGHIFTYLHKYAHIFTHMSMILHTLMNIFKGSFTYRDKDTLILWHIDSFIQMNHMSMFTNSLIQEHKYIHSDVPTH